MGMNGHTRKFPFWGVAAILALTLAASALADRRGAQQLSAPLGSIPVTMAGWTFTRDYEMDDRSTERLNASQYVLKEYAKGGNRLELFIAYYTRQSSTGYMHSPKICLPSSGWDIEQPGTANVLTPLGERTINRYVISNGGEKSLIFYWYQSTDRIVADEYVTKLYMIHDGLMYGRGAGSIVRIQLPLDPDVEKEGLKFATAVMGDLRRVYGSRAARN
jgi:EpsI family protein